MGALSKGKTEPAGTAQWLRSDEPPGQELEKPLRLSFSQLPTNTKASVFTGSLVMFRAHSFQLPMQLKRSRTIIKQGLRQAGWARAAAARDAAGRSPAPHTRAEHPRASGLPCSGLAAAGRKEVSAAARLLSGAKGRPALPPDPHHLLSRSVHGPPTPGRLDRCAPAAPGPRRAVPKLRAPLRKPARARHPHPLPLPHSAGPGMPPGLL